MINCSPTFRSNVTGKQFILSKTGDFSCKSMNIIYLITCSDCGIQYVGQTIQALHVRLNAHRSCVNGNTNTYLYKHYNSTNGHKFENATIQIIDCHTVDSNSLDSLENYWIATLCTAYPLGLNDRLEGTGNVSKNKVNCSDCYFTKPILRRKRGHGKKKKEKRVNGNVVVTNQNQVLNNTIINDLIQTLEYLFSNNLRQFYLKLRSLNKLLLKAIILKVTTKQLHFSPILQSFFHNMYERDKPSSEHKEREYIVLPFNCKFIDSLKPDSILRDSAITTLLPNTFKERLPLRIFYKYNVTIGRKLLNYNTFLKHLTNNDILDILSKDCSCSSSDYSYAPHGHVVTGDMNIIANDKLRNIMFFGAKFREALSLTPDNIKVTLYSYIDQFIQLKANKYRLDPKSLEPWGRKVKSVIENRINFFVTHKPNIFLDDKSVFEDRVISDYVKSLQNEYIIVVADKASNNFVIVCKKFYTIVLMNELGIDSNNLVCNGNITYSLFSEDQADTINKTAKALKDGFNINCLVDNLRIPNIFWNPKLHKNPYKPRFIAGAKHSVTKELETLLNKGLQVIKSHFGRYCKAIFHRTGINCNWSIGSSFEFLDRIKHLEIWSMQVYDFSTLYTSLDLKDVENTLFDLSDLLFSPRHKYICINPYKSFFSTKKYNGYTCFDQALFKKAISFILNNTFVAFAGFVLKQTRGIPMGGSCSSPIADLFLSYKEFNFMKRLLKEKKFNLARLLSNNSRYVDDLNIINYQLFNNRAKEIYPDVLQLERSGDNEKNVVYLDVRVKVSNEGVTTSLYNKTDDFDFPVVSYTFPESNIPKQLGYNVFYGQVLRYSAIFSVRQEFVSKTAKLFRILNNRGYSHNMLIKTLKKVFKNNIYILYKFGFKISSEVLAELQYHLSIIDI